MAIGSLNLIKLSRPFIFTFLFFVISSPQPLWAQASASCQAVFAERVESQSVIHHFEEQAAPKSITYFIDQVNTAQAQKKNEPRFLDPAEEAALVPLWKGTRQGPRALRDTLLDNTAFLDFQLLAADAGAVKIAQPGNFTSLRLNHTWEGQNMSTNVGLPIDAILARSLLGQKQLVPETAKAVIIFKHGGGTKTTGHHVAAALSNFMAQYGVVVVAMDAPFHAYGPREADLEPLDYYRYLASFRRQFIPKNVPTFIGGHSMGGLHADNLMRLSDREDLGLHDAFAGLINLSGPMDNAPGLNLREKNKAESELTRNEEIMNLVPEAERDLSVLLLTQGKASPLGGLSAETFMAMVNWQETDHNGSDYIPTVAIMGERDALYVGRENIFDRYISQLSNTTSHIMGLRTDFKGRESWVSHMIFDHYIPGTEKPESFNLIKNFVEERLGETLESSGHHSLLSEFNGSTVGLVSRLVQEYYNNLAFRYFAHQYFVLEKIGKERISEIGVLTSQMSREARTLQNEIKNLSKEDPNNTDLPNMKARLNEMQTEMNRLRSQQQSQFVPENEGELTVFAQNNVDRRRELNKIMNNLIAEKKDLSKKLNQTREKKNRLQNSLDKTVETEIEQGSIQSSSILEARQAYEDRFIQMVRVQETVNAQNSELVVRNHEQGQGRINPSPELIQAYRDLDQQNAQYNQAKKELKKAIEVAIAQGALSEATQSTLLQLYGTQEAHLNGTPTEDSLIGQTNNLRHQIESLEFTYSEHNREVNQLLIEYIERVTPDLYHVRMANMVGELDRPLKDLIGQTSTLEKLWKIWIDIWKERPPEQGTSLY